MAISPEQAKQLTPKGVKKLKSIEESIDLWLQANFRGERLTISSKELDLEVDDRLYDYIIDLYKKAGWKVTKKSDQRDGDWLEFVPA